MLKFRQQSESFNFQLNIVGSSEAVIRSAWVQVGEEKIKAKWKKEKKAIVDHEVATKRHSFSVLYLQKTDEEVEIQMSNLPEKTDIIIAVEFVSEGKIDDSGVQFLFPFCSEPKKGVVDVHTLTLRKLEMPAQKSTVDCTNICVRDVKDAVLVAETRSFNAMNQFLLSVKTEIPALYTLAEKSDRSKKSLVAHLHARFEIPKYTNTEISKENELTIILDGSGSMAGEKIETVSSMFSTLMEHLMRIYGSELTIQVVVFGSDAKFFLEDSSPLTPNVYKHLIEWMPNINAGYGGTSACTVMIQVLEQIARKKLL